MSNNNLMTNKDNMKNVYLKPIFSSGDIGNDLIFINCTLGYNGNINLHGYALDAS